MIVYRQWKAYRGKRLAKEYTCEGWFLFGIIPLYIRRIGAWS